MSSPTDFEVTTARMKSYTGSAVLTFILYWLFWLPGLIVNYMFYSEAKRMEKIAGQSLPGVGRLSVMLWLNAIVLVLALLGVCLLIVMFASGA